MNEQDWQFVLEIIACGVLIGCAFLAIGGYV